MSAVEKGQMYQHHSGRFYQVHEVVTGGTKVNSTWDYEPLIVYYLVYEPIKRYARFEHDFLSSMTRAS